METILRRSIFSPRGWFANERLPHESAENEEPAPIRDRSPVEDFA